LQIGGRNQTSEIRKNAAGRSCCGFGMKAEGVGEVSGGDDATRRLMRYREADDRQQTRPRFQDEGGGRWQKMFYDRADYQEQAKTMRPAHRGDWRPAQMDRRFLKKLEEERLEAVRRCRRVEN